MPSADLASIKQSIVSAGRCVVEVAIAHEGAFADHLAAFMVGGAVVKLSKLVKQYRDGLQSARAASRNTRQDTKFNVDDFVIQVPDENLRCVDILGEVLDRIGSRWKEEEREFFSKLADYYEGCTCIDGEPIGPPLWGDDAAAPEQTRVALSRADIDGLRAAIARLELTEATSDSLSLEPRSQEGGANTDSSKAYKRSRNEERDEWIYDEYVKGTDSKIIASRLVQQGWSKIEGAAAVRGVVKRFAERRNLPTPRKGQGINHRITLPESN